MKQRKLAIGILGRWPLHRQAYRSLLAGINQRVTIDSGFDAKSVWAALRAKPDLILVDADDVNGTAIDCVQMILRLNREIQILVVSGALDAAAVHAWSSCDIHGYVVKDGGIDELAAALDAIADGRRYFSGSVRDMLSDRGRSGLNGVPLSPRESQLLPMLARGMKLRDAAEQMSVTYKTADSHRTRLMRKLGVSSRVELARYAIRKHIIDP